MKLKQKEIEKELKALANSRRLTIIKILKDKKEMSVGEIARELKLSIKATSKHLSVLKSVNIVEYEQRSLLYFYKLVSPLPESTKAILSLF